MSGVDTINIIEAENLTFGYGAEPVLENVGFSVRAGEFVALIGANGSGKSTLLTLLLGEQTPGQGVIRLFGQDSRQFKDWAKIGYVAQNGIAKGAGFPATCEEIVKASLYSQIGFMRFAKKTHAEKARAALKLVDMEAYADRLIGNLSGGQQQRVMIARVLAGQPEIMLLDEPTTGIDAASVQSLYKLLSRLNRETGLTVVMVTHDIARASGYAGRTLCLEDGSLVELKREQIIDELSHRHKHPEKGCVCGENTQEARG